MVTPARAITRGQQLTIVVRYAGVPSETLVDGYTGWTRTDDGALAVNEPESAWWWFPSNDHPLDKATFDISVSVPTGVEVISNGVQPRPPLAEAGNRTRWSWRSTTPSATYLAFMAIGQYDIVTDTTPGRPAGDQRVQHLAGRRSGRPRGPASNGPARSSTGRAGSSARTRSRREAAWPGRSTASASPWRRRPDRCTARASGDAAPTPTWWPTRTPTSGSATPSRWPSWSNIWLNEGFASYAEWLWSEEQGEGTAQELFDFTYASYPADDAFWQVLPGDPGADRVFDDAVYDRGAMTLHQLRLAVGDDAFFEILPAWTAEHRYGNGTIAQFQALAERISGLDLDALFTTWLFTAGRPDVATAARKASPPTEPRSWAKIREAHELMAALVDPARRPSATAAPPPTPGGQPERPRTGRPGGLRQPARANRRPAATCPKLPQASTQPGPARPRTDRADGAWTQGAGSITRSRPHEPRVGRIRHGRTARRHGSAGTRATSSGQRPDRARAGSGVSVQYPRWSSMP